MEQFFTFFRLKVGMEVGTLRERIIAALLIYKFGESNVETEIPITESEVDLLLFGKSLSVKTKTGKGFHGVKLIWTVDAQKAKEFCETYNPHCDIMLIQINCESTGGVFYLPLEVQNKIFMELDRERYFKMPKPGTNPRGVEIPNEALSRLTEEKGSQVIEILWRKTEIDFDPYKRWVEYWRED